MDTSREPLRCWIRDMHVAHMQKAHVALARFSINLPPGPKSDIALERGVFPSLVGMHLLLASEGAPLARVVAAVFATYLRHSTARHSVAV